jgi:hypothetical protein
MNLEDFISNACIESSTGVRRGDKKEETEGIREYILNSKKIAIPNCNDEKVAAVNEVLSELNLPKADHLNIHTDSCDVSRMPAVTKALMALDMTDADLVIARGRLGVPGSGSMLVIVDHKGRLLSASLSPSHHLHGKTVYEAVKEEMKDALSRIGFDISGGG